MKKRFLAALLALVMVVGMLPMAALAGGYWEPDHGIWIMVGEDPKIEIDVTTEENQSGNGWSWNGKTKTLRLENFVGYGLHFGACGNVTLELVGDNIVGRDREDGLCINDGNEGTAGDPSHLLITGEGSLTTNRMTIQRVHRCEISVTLESGTWMVEPYEGWNESQFNVYNGKLTMLGGSLSVNKGINIGYGGTLTVKGGALTASGGKYGIYAKDYSSFDDDGAGFVVLGGEVTLEGSIAALTSTGGWSDSTNEPNDNYVERYNPFNKLHTVAVGGEAKGDTLPLQMKHLYTIADEPTEDIFGDLEYKHTVVYALSAGELTLDDGDQDPPLFSGAAKYAKLTPDPNAVQLAQPKNLTWGKAYDRNIDEVVDWAFGMSWEVDGPCDDLFDVKFCDDNRIYSLDANKGYELVKVGNHYYTPAYEKYGFGASETYYYTVTSVGRENSQYIESAPAISPDYDYIKPTATLESPKEVKWNNYAFSWKWDGKEADLAGFELILLRSETKDGEMDWAVHFGLEFEDGEWTRESVQHAVETYGANYYAFELCARAKDITKYNDSEVVRSEAIYLDENTDFNVTTPPDKPTNPGGGSSGGGGSSSGGGSSKPVEPENPPVEPENPPVEPETPATPASEKFDDVAKDSWYEAGVTYVTDKGLFQGVAEGVFAPNTNMTRAMLMTVLARLDGQETSGGATWYAKAMDWAKAQGISDGSAPDGSVTREQLVTMLYRYAKPEKAEGGLDGFSDKGEVSAWAKEAMEWAVANNIVTGKSGARLDPRGTATRAEVATIIQRFVAKTEK